MSIKVAGAIIAAFVLLLGIVVFKAGNEIKDLSSQLVECNNFSASLQISVARQNEAIEAANKSLNEYSLQLKENNETWSKKLAEQKKKVQNVKSCDDSLDYLKQMVEGLK